jgi:UDP-perosamine 4-acetyltransferase
LGKIGYRPIALLSFPPDTFDGAYWPIKKLTLYVLAGRATARRCNVTIAINMIVAAVGASVLSSRRRQLVIVGSGGHAKVVIELVRALEQFDIVGCLDPDPSAGDGMGLPILGGDEELEKLYRLGVRSAFVALGANRLRIKLGTALINQGFEVPSLVHPCATVSLSARIGRGVVIMAGAVVNAQATIGDFCIVNTLSSVDHDCVLGTGSHVAPRSALAGSVQLGIGVFMGIGSVAINNIEIGDFAVVGAGGVVVSDLAPGVLALGVPAKSRVKTSSNAAV